MGHVVLAQARAQNCHAQQHAQQTVGDTSAGSSMQHQFQAEAQNAKFQSPTLLENASQSPAKLAYAIYVREQHDAVFPPRASEIPIKAANMQPGRQSPSPSR
jgi:hypothetical protein